MTRNEAARATSALLGALAVAIISLASCTALLGDDFEILDPGDGGATATGGSAGAPGGSPATGGGAGGEDPCGNGEPDPGETCDGDCPLECIDEDRCTDDTMVGSPEQCTATCPFGAVETCAPNDGCCPEGCHQLHDNDCDMRVAIISADMNGAPWVQDQLLGTGVFGGVDVLDGYGATPTLDDLAPYAAAFVYTTYQGFADPVELGNVLANFHDAGGRVVLANGANCENYALGGRFVDDGYSLLEFGTIYPNSDDLGPIAELQTPLLIGVTELQVGEHCDGQPVAGATALAWWETTGAPVLVYGWVQGRRRVDLNFLPTFSEGDGAQLLANALRFQ